MFHERARLDFLDEHSPALLPELRPKGEPKLEPLDDPELTLFNAHGTAGTSSGVGFNSPEQSNSNIYSEFDRISELFRNAFYRKHDDDISVLDPEPGAIVQVPGSGSHVTQLVVPRRKSVRSSELVRVMDLQIEDQRYFRDVIRKTRMLFDSLRIFTAVDEAKRGVFKNVRGDVKAATAMAERNLWLNRDKRIIGSIPGIYVGDLFFFRIELCVVGLHGQVQGGIDYVPARKSSSGEPIATSIVVSGGYEDDEDGGDVIIYTGQGGQDKQSRQNSHQKLAFGNLALERSMHYGIEVRVIRGFKYGGSISGKVYVYDGLYRITWAWFDVGKSGFGVYKYRLVRMEGQSELGSSVLRFAENLRSNPLIARPTGYICMDISKSAENFPVFLFNDIDDDRQPTYYDYLQKTAFPHFVYYQGLNYSGCGCASGCTHACSCTMKNGGALPYDQNGILLRGRPLIFECGVFCKCPRTCRNRVSQRGVQNRLEVFRSRETSWGVRSLNLIQAGSFICEYTGLALTREQANVMIMNGDSLVYPDRFAVRWSEWGDLSQIYTADHSCPSYSSPPPPSVEFAMDVSKMRNVACYISHSPSPNVFVQFVLYDHHNALFPRLMLFALENIPPLRELSLDYGVADEWTTGEEP